MSTIWTNVTAFLTNGTAVTINYSSTDNTYQSIINFVQMNVSKGGFWDTVNNKYYPSTSIQMIQVS